MENERHVPEHKSGRWWSSKRLPSLIGQRYGRLTVVADAGRIKGRAYWICECDCGSPFKRIQQGALRNGNTQSCGCYNKERNRITKNWDGRSKTSEYKIWQKMILRCTYPDCWEYVYYGGRGIKVCERWRTSFLNFYEDMGARPSMKFTVERIDNDGDYAPENCRWATRFEQAQNRRNTRRIVCNGATKTLLEWARELNTSVEYIRTRLKRGWPEDKAVSVPINRTLTHVRRKGARAYN